MTRVTAERQIKQNKISVDSIYVFKKYPLKNMTANGVIFFMIAVNVKDKYLITDYVIFPFKDTSKILKKILVLWPEGTSEYITLYRFLFTAIKVKINATEALNKISYSG